jgi:hypothetical protein
MAEHAVGSYVCKPQKLDGQIARVASSTYWRSSRPPLWTDGGSACGLCPPPGQQHPVEKKYQ